MIRNKTIKFDMDKQEDKELWEYLAKLPHGEFTERVKGYFRDLMFDQAFDQKMFNETKIEYPGHSVRLFDIKKETWRGISGTMKKQMEEHSSEDHPFSELLESTKNGEVIRIKQKESEPND